MQHYQSASIPPIAPVPAPMPRQYVPPQLTLVWNDAGSSAQSTHPRPLTGEARGRGRGGRLAADVRQVPKSLKRDVSSISPSSGSAPSNKSSRHSNEDVPTSGTSLSFSKLQSNAVTSSVDAKVSESIEVDDDDESEDFGENAAIGVGKGGPDGDLTSLLKLIPPKYRSAAQVGDSAAEIDKWRAARRRHFPTESVVAAKAAAQVSAAARGELQTLQSTGKIMRRSSTAALLVPPIQIDDKSVVHSDTLPIVDEGPEELGVSRESALRAIDEEKKAADDAIFQEGGNTGGRNGLGPCIRNLRGQCQRGPLCYYPHGPNCTYTHEQILNHKKPCRFFLLGKCRMDKLCPFQHTGGASKKNSGEEARGGLLSKLLKSEVESETSMILQCIRYAVAENFFKE